MKCDNCPGPATNNGFLCDRCREISFLISGKPQDELVAILFRDASPLGVRREIVVPFGNVEAAKSLIAKRGLIFISTRTVWA